MSDFICLTVPSRSVVNKTIEVYGEIDVLVNNAGISMRALFSDLDLSVFDKVLKVNFYGTLYCRTKY